MLPFKFPKRASFIGICSLSMLSGCFTPVEDLKPTTFDQTKLNRASNGRIVTLLSILPSEAKVDNTNNSVAESTGEVIGGTLGLVGGSITIALGAAIGKAIGNAIEPPELHPQSLILVFQDPNHPKIQQTIEIAKVCEFKTGPAYAVEMDYETRVQPNNLSACISVKDKEKQQKKEKKEQEKRNKELAKQLPPLPQPTGPVSECPFTSVLCQKMNLASPDGWVVKGDLVDPKHPNSGKTKNCSLKYHGMELNDQNEIKITDPEMQKIWQITPYFQDTFHIRFSNPDMTLNLPVSTGDNPSPLTGWMPPPLYKKFMATWIDSTQMAIEGQHKSLSIPHWNLADEKQALTSFNLCLAQE